MTQKGSSAASITNQGANRNSKAAPRTRGKRTWQTCQGMEATEHSQSRPAAHLHCGSLQPSNHHILKRNRSTERGASVPKQRQPQQLFSLSLRLPQPSTLIGEQTRRQRTGQRGNKRKRLHNNANASLRRLYNTTG